MAPKRKARSQPSSPSSKSTKKRKAKAVKEIKPPVATEPHSSSPTSFPARSKPSSSFSRPTRKCKAVATEPHSSSPTSFPARSKPSSSSRPTRKRKSVATEPHSSSPTSFPARSKPSSSSSRPTRKRKAVATEPHSSSPTSFPARSRPSSSSSKPTRKRKAVAVVEDVDWPEPKFVGEPFSDEEARARWPKRYVDKVQTNSSAPSTSKAPTSKSKEKRQASLRKDEDSFLAKRHYARAEVDGIVYELNDEAHVRSNDRETPYICTLVELFEATDGSLKFSAQWYYRAQDTVIRQHSEIHPKRIFASECQDDNHLECLLGKVNIAKLLLNVDEETKSELIANCDYYCDMKYLLPYTTFVKLLPDSLARTETEPEISMLDLYSGCGAMSSGLCLGAHLSKVKLVTRWAVDANEHACESLKLNHPETEVRNESAEDFLSLLKQWEKLCIYFKLIETNDSANHGFDFFDEEDLDGGEDSNGDDEEDSTNAKGEFYVERILEICYGDPYNIKRRGLHCKIRWEGYDDADEDTWEPIEKLRKCKERICEFVCQGYASQLLPLPGIVGVVCGGPPCQGISGHNRHRNKENPFADEKNKQIKIFMDIVEHLKPKHILMENVVDILKFDSGSLGRYALGRLVHMTYQSRIGIMAAGAYGLPQFRLRAFLWGASPTESLPQYPLPTHDVVVRGFVPIEFENNAVAYNVGDESILEEKLFLADAISDLPLVMNSEQRDEMEYEEPPKTEFQKCIRLSKHYLMQLPMNEHLNDKLYDHRPLKMNTDDYERACHIPKKKGANFRNLPGVCVVGNKVMWDPKKKREKLKSGKPLVPDYAMEFRKGTSLKPFARLWWDETVPTVVTRAEPHNQAILYPTQDRVLTIRENARLQGFPDYYKLTGPVKERYTQVGNAVAVPVARALGFALGLARQDRMDDGPTFQLPPKFPLLSV